MARPDKVAAVADVKGRFEASAALLLTNYRGLTVGELAELRAELRKANATYRVSKNTLIRRAMHDSGVEGLDEMLVGPTALVFCADDPVGPAKALKAFLKDHPDLEFKGGLLEGEVLDAEAALGLADLDSREDLLARLAGLMYGALANTARLLAALPQKQAQLIQALIEDGGAAGADGAAVTEAADEAAAEAQEESADEPTADAESTDDAPEASDEADASEPEAAAGDEPEAAAAESDEAPEAATADAEPEAATADEPEAADEAATDDADNDEEDASDEEA